MSEQQVTPETPQAATPSVRELADLVLDSFNGYDLAAADIVAALEVAKSIIMMDCVADLLAHTRAVEIVDELVGAAKPTVN